VSSSPVSSWIKKLRTRFVSSIYANHNKSGPIRVALDRCLSLLTLESRGLVVGAGATKLHPAVINLDIVPGDKIDVCASAEQLPFPDEMFELVLSQEVLEHVRDPLRAMCEMKRVLKKGGTLYCQVPFIIGYHPGPTDFWRFTKEGIRELIQKAGFTCDEVKLAVGPGTGFYRILVEFFASVAARLSDKLYIPVKGACALFFYPLKWLDPMLLHSSQCDRISGGYLATARR
jgi:SAM-dependent methyltransferase